MAITCGNCGEIGHNARTCPTKGGGARAAKKAAAAAVEEPASFVEQIEARRAKLEREIQTIDRVLPELRTLEGTV